MTPARGLPRRRRGCVVSWRGPRVARGANPPNDGPPTPPGGRKGEGHMRVSLVLCTALVAICSIVAATSAATAAPPATAAVPVPITGTLPGGGTFNGTFDLQRFANQNRQVVAIGALSGTLTNAAGTVLGTVNKLPLTIPLANLNGSCQILNLTLGPLDLDLLGLQVHLNQVHLNITAQQGPGNLLGNLLCSVAHLLDGNGSNNALVSFLNRIPGSSNA